MLRERAMGLPNEMETETETETNLGAESIASMGDKNHSTVFKVELNQSGGALAKTPSKRIGNGSTLGLKGGKGNSGNC